MHLHTRARQAASALVLLLAISATNTPAYSQLVTLENAQAYAVIAPHAGGRIVAYGPVGGPNLLLGDPEALANAEKVPEPETASGYAPFHGHIYWVSPQAAWVQAGGERNVWPPDPWLIYGRDQIMLRTDTHLVLKGTTSPRAGVRIDKEFRLHSDGSLHLTATLHPTGPEPVEWAIWSNTRLPIESRLEVPSAGDGEARYSHQPAQDDTQPWRLVTEGTNRRLDLSNAGQVHGKAHLPTAKQEVSATRSGWTLVKRAITPVSPTRIPPGHAPVEIFATKELNPALNFLEVEFHGDLIRLEPGEQTAFEEVWELREP